jgi:hypothetical protein
MFKCAITGKNSKPGEEQKKLVIERREKQYTDPDTGEVIATGWEIVKEIAVTDEGLRIYQEQLLKTT